MIGRGEFTWPDKGFEIWEPHLLAVLDATEGMLLELRAVGALQKTGQGKIGKGTPPMDSERPDILEARARYCIQADATLSAMQRRAAAAPPGEPLHDLFIACEGRELGNYWSRVYMKELVG